MGQEPVQLYDPINEYVSAELSKRFAGIPSCFFIRLTFKRAQEYTSEKFIDIFVGTLNLNGKEDGLRMDLTPWLKPDFIDKTRRRPSLVVVGFQEIVELSPKEIMSTDPVRRQKWETAILRNLNNEGPKDPYVLLRSGQLVGAALMIFARSSKIHYIKNVEGSIQKVKNIYPSLVPVLREKRPACPGLQGIKEPWQYASSMPILVCASLRHILLPDLAIQMNEIVIIIQLRMGFVFNVIGGYETMKQSSGLETSTTESDFRMSASNS